MSATAMMTLTATIFHTVADGQVDDYGNPAPGETVMSARCELQQFRSAEDTVNTDRQSEDWRLFLCPTGVADDLSAEPDPVDTVIEGGDTVEVDGILYQVDGPPWPARNPRTGIVSHIEARVRRVV